MGDAKTALVKYVFFDVVGFTQNRSVEAQSDVIGILNSVVKGCLAKLSLDPAKTILIPTGDGICIALLDILDPYDIHVTLALNILSSVHAQNTAQHDAMRVFEIRVGICENVDNLVIDINGSVNVAGLGINWAQRVMSAAGASQIVVSQNVYDTLRGREKYMKSFAPFSAKTKHDEYMAVYQFVDTAIAFLNSRPLASADQPQSKKRLKRFVAHYLTHAIKNRPVLLTRKDDPQFQYSATVLLYFLAEDSIAQADTPEHGTFSPRVVGGPKASILQRYLTYNEMTFWVIAELASHIHEKHLEEASDCFEDAGFSANYAFASRRGIERLAKEWPKLAAQHSIKS